MFDLKAALNAEQARRAGRDQSPAPSVGIPSLPMVPEVQAAVPTTGPEPIFIAVTVDADQEPTRHGTPLSPYIHGSGFRIQGIAVSFRNRRYWFSAEEFKEHAQRTLWSRLAVVAYDALFNAAVLAWRFDVQPARWVDIQAMARGAYPHCPDDALPTLAAWFGVDQPLAGARDRHPGSELVLLEHLYARLAPGYPPAELALIDQTVRQCTEPCLTIEGLALFDFIGQTQYGLETPDIRRGRILLDVANISDSLPVELNYYGTATGRFSGGSGGGVNLHNLPRRSDLRRFIQAPCGHRLVGGDSAQIEVRVLAWLAGEDGLLDAFRAGRDVYCEFASVFFDRPITKADDVERQLGKTAILGLGYGMGEKTFAKLLCAHGIGLPTSEVARLVKTYRQTYSRITALWFKAGATLAGDSRSFGRLDMTLQEGRIALPNGLSLHYPALRREADGQWRYMGRGKRHTLYGGKLVENVIQALSRIVVMEQQQRLAQEFKVAFSIHDELVCCVPEAVADACRQRILTTMATPPDWAPDLPLACEVVVGRTLADL